MSEQQNQNSEQPEQQPESFTITQEAIDTLINSSKAKFHVWRQRGPWVVCTSCSSNHSSWIGTEKVLTGIDEEGNPILKRKER